MIYKIGWIKEAIWDKNTYRVRFRDQYDAFPVRRVENGANEPLEIDDQVLCLYTKQTNWLIIGRIPTPQKYTKDDSEKSEEQRLLEQQRKLIGEYISGETNAGVGDDGVPNYYPEDEEPLAFGDAQIRSRTSGSFVRADSSGSVLAVVSNILCMVMDTFKTGILSRCKQYILDVIPGFRMKIWNRPKQNSPQVPSAPTSSTQTEQMVLEATLASDPDSDEVDFDLEAGSLRDIDDAGYGVGRASETTPYKLKRGARLRLANFGMLEIDNDEAEVRLSFPFGEDPSSLYQMRFNSKEATLSWGTEQFISLTDQGLLIKAKNIGLAGPLIMWDPTKVASFQHNKDLTEADLGAVIEWDATQTYPGLKVNKSIYFGDKGEPAVTKPYLEQVFANFVELNDKHTHVATGFNVPTSQPAIPLKPIIDVFLKEPVVDTFLTIVKAPATPST